MLFGVNNITNFLDNNKISVENDDKFKPIIELQENIDKILSDIKFSKPNKIMQGNTSKYTYDEKGIGYGYNYGFENDNFRKWFNKNDENIFVNVHPINSSNKLTSNTAPRQSSNNKRFGIADIYPAAINARISFLLYVKYIKTYNPKNENKIRSMVALHILETYILNAYGRFAHDGSYNSSISDNFSFV